MTLYENELCEDDCKVCGEKFTLHRSSRVFSSVPS
jgi:hypothetical protein